MNLSEDSKFTSICTHCNHIITSYTGQNQICLRQFHSSQNHQKNKSNVTTTRSIQTNQVNKYENKLIDITGNSKLDEFIEETQNNSKYCDDFIEWIPNNYLENVNYLAKGGNSNIFCGTWNLTIPLAIKSIKDTGDQFLNEFKMHHKCRSQSVIPFYGITKVPGRNEYAMVIRRAKHGDLRNYIRDFFPKLTWADRIEILINISKALKHIHEMNLIHRDFHCKNVLVDEDRSILICDFGLCTPVDLEIASDNKIQGVLPYIAPEVLKKKPYTKKSEVYSLSMIMWELTSNESPFSDRPHDKYLAIQIIEGQRPIITKETPDFYAKFMEQCWDPDPSKRPDSSDLPKLFEEMMDLCKNLKYDTISPNSSLFRNIERKPEFDKSLGYTLSITAIDFTENDDERVSVVNDKDEELVEELLTTSEKIIVEKSVEKENKDTVATIQNSTTTEKAKEIVSLQKEDGSLEVTDTVSNGDTESTDILVSNFKSYFINKGTKAPENKKLLDTAITLSFLRKTSSTDTSPELKEKVVKAEKYLKTELGSDEKIEKLLKTTDTVIVEHATKKVIKEKAEQTIVKEIQETVTEEEITKVIEIQNKEGSYEKISDKITEKLGIITTENISSSVRITDERVKKFDTKVWNTFITIAYCNKVLGKQQLKVTTQNEKALAWLHTQIKDEKLVKEVLESCEKIVVEKASNKKKESSWPSLSTSLTSWGSSWGKYISDTAKSTTEGIYEVARQTTDSVQHTADTVSSTLVNLKSNTTPETTKKIVVNQKPDGSIKLDKTVSDQINISSDNIQSSVQTYGVSDKLKSVPKNVWETALSLRYLTITSQSQDQHKEQSEKAKKYLIDEFKEEKLVEELLTTSEKIIVDQSVKKGKEDAVSTIKSSITTEKAKEIVSTQSEDGSIKLPDTVSNESLVSGWESGWGKYIADTAKSTTEGILQVAKKTTDSVLEATQPETEPKAEPGWFDNIATTEKANDDHEIEDSRYNTQTYDFSLDDLN